MVLPPPHRETTAQERLGELQVAPEGLLGAKKVKKLIRFCINIYYKTETDFGDFQIIVLSHIFVQIIVLSLFSPDYRISTREY